MAKTNAISICPKCLAQVIDTQDQEVSCGPFCCFETIEIFKRDHELLKKYFKPSEIGKSPTIKKT